MQPVPPSQPMPAQVFEDALTERQEQPQIHTKGELKRLSKGELVKAVQDLEVRVAHSNSVREGAVNEFHALLDWVVANPGKHPSEFLQERLVEAKQKMKEVSQ